MSTNHTPNYNLSQWVRTDKVQMDDFNADNAKLDAALAGKAEKQALAEMQAQVDTKADAAVLETLSQTVAGHAATLAGKGNCRIYSTSYAGTGRYGQDTPNRLSFPARPLVVLIVGTDGSHGVFVPGQTSGFSYNTGGSVLTVSWSGNALSWSHHTNTSAQLNSSGTTYNVIALMTA